MTEAGVKALHLVSAWATDHRLVLAQSKVQDKSNQITAIPALLELLDIKGCIVTLDAMGTQKSIAAQIQQAQADYILSLKANHPTLFQQVDTWFQASRAADTFTLRTQNRSRSSSPRNPLLLGAPARPITSLISGRDMGGTANNCHRRAHPPFMESHHP
jgi:predicted transposase YbfD/YdcC